MVLLMYQAYMALNDIDAAVESLKKACDLEPNDGQWLRFHHNHLFIFYFLLIKKKKKLLGDSLLSSVTLKFNLRAL